jgi:dTDP-glucose 4,6-dehydratase
MQATQTTLQDLKKTQNYTFIHGDITDASFIQTLFEKHAFKHAIHLAAESHVDRSIEDPFVFAKNQYFRHAKPVAQL